MTTIDTKLLREITGNKFDVQQLNSAADITLALCINVSYLERTIIQNEFELLKNITNKLEEAIKDTKIYKNTTQNQTIQIETLQKQINDLQQYKTYYDLHYQMENGTKEQK